MIRRKERICSAIRRTIAEAVLSKVSDPRIDPARTSITNVEIAEDLLVAKVFISVLGDEAAQRRTIEAMRHAAGYFQALVGRQVQLRYTPTLEFHADVQFKKTLETLEVLQQSDFIKNSNMNTFQVLVEEPSVQFRSNVKEAQHPYVSSCKCLIF